MPDLVISKSAFGTDVTIDFQLIAGLSDRRPVHLEDSTTGLSAGYKRASIALEDVTISLPANDDMPPAPGSEESTWWQATVRGPGYERTYYGQIALAVPSRTWNEFIEAGVPLDPSDIWSARLPPDPSSEPDNRWLKTESGSYVFTDAPAGGHVIEDDGTPMAQRAALNFRGAAISDDAGNDATVVDVTITEIVGASGF